uniref:MAM domain-containing protein n=1 Tax=Mesocestoides corti TaxID=53468 RepID=A0A5K3EXW7_MESCO
MVFANVASASDSPTPFHVWDFDKDVGGWANDANNWNLKWTVDRADGDGLMCLFRKPLTPLKTEVSDPWEIEDHSPSRGEGEDVKAWLWSRKIPAKFGIRCITLLFKVSLGSDAFIGSQSDIVSVAMLQRQEG